MIVTALRPSPAGLPAASTAPTAGMSAAIAAAPPSGEVAPSPASGYPPAPAPVQPVQPSSEGSGADAAGLAGRGDDHRREARPDPAPDPAAEAMPADPVHASVLSLMQRTAQFCRNANTDADPAAPHGTGAQQLLSGLADGLQVRGNLVVAGPAGLHIGNGQIYREGQLIAAFAGNMLTLLRGRVSTRM